MTNEEYINELRVLVQKAQTLLGATNLHENVEFRKWRQKLQALLIAAEEKNYNIESNVISRDFDIFVAYGSQPTFKERMGAFNRDLQDTINELETIIEFHDNYGDQKSKENSSSGSRHQKELEYPQKVTLSWLAKHAPIRLWIKFVGILIAAFLLGLGLLKTSAYENIQLLWQTEKQTNPEKQEPNMAPLPTPKSGAAEL